MIIKIEKEKYYGYQNKTKKLFKKKYRSLKLKWMESVKVGDEVVKNMEFNKIETIKEKLALHPDATVNYEGLWKAI